MLMSRLRESLHHAALGRALFSTESAFSVKSWTVSQRVAGAASSSTEIINIKPDGKSTVVIFFLFLSSKMSRSKPFYL